MAKGILVLNAGSSSIKFSLFELNAGQFTAIYRGNMEGITVRPHFVVKDQHDQKVFDADIDIEMIEGKRHAQTLSVLLKWVDDHMGDLELVAVGHRIVHGGDHYDHGVLVTPEVIAELDALTPLAPLHQPHNLRPIHIINETRSVLPQVACFDTAYHRTHHPVSQVFALPKKYTEKGIKRYGFHGLSYHYISTVLSDYLPEEKANGRVLVAHLGNGSSACAIKNRKSYASTLGFTAIEGLPMGTRCGTLDPGVVLYLIEQEGLSPAEVNRVLYKESGLLGMSNGLSSDMRDLLSSESPDAKQAIEVFAYQIARQLTALTTDVGGIDALVFTAGIGERADYVRQRVCEWMSWLGIELDHKANQDHAHIITRPNSPVTVCVIPTNEELMIAQQTATELNLI